VSSATTALERARAAFARGDDDAAVQEVARLAAAGDLPDEALVLGVNAALRGGQLETAIGWLERLHAAQPAHPPFARLLATAHNNLGARRLDAGALDAASAAFARALALQPDHPEALFNRARLALLARQPARALDDLARLCALRPGDPAAALLRAETEVALGATDPLARLTGAVGSAALATIDPLRVALCLADGADADGALARVRAETRPERALAAADVAWRLAENGDDAAARAANAHVAALCAHGARPPGLYAAIAAELTLPQVYDDAAAIDRARARHLAGLDALSARYDPAALARCAPLLEQVAWSNQMLAYQGRDDREPAARWAGFLARAARALAPALCAPPRGSRTRRRRIGFISAAWRRSTIATYFRAWIAAAASAGHEVVLVQLPPAADAVTEELGRVAGGMLRPKGTLHDIALQVRALDLDLALYPDLGVDGRVSVLAALGMAPRQAMGWGHPCTFGLPTVRDFIACAAMEPADAGRHYSERLRLLPGTGTAWQRPPSPPVLPREALGLPPGPMFLVPQLPYTVHPDTDAALAAIAAAQPRATIALFAGERPGPVRRLRARLSAALARAGADPARQLRFLPQVDRARFLATCATADVMVDTHHWSGGNTTLDCLHVGLPVVTVPGALMRGRQSAAMLQAMGLDDLVCADAAAQARAALAIADDAPRRAALRRRIEDGFPALLDDAAARAAFVALLDDLLAEPAADA
jgi:CRISPR-associated protein Csy1